MKTFNIKNQECQLTEKGFKEVLRINGVQLDSVKGEPVTLKLFHKSPNLKDVLTMQYFDGYGFMFESVNDKVEQV